MIMITMMTMISHDVATFSMSDVPILEAAPTLLVAIPEIIVCFCQDLNAMVEGDDDENTCD